MQAAYCGRFAPAPTGPLHLGSLLTALAGFLQARASGGKWHVRIDDLDTPRCLPGADTEILRTLERFGLYWDGPVIYQNQRRERYQAALTQLERRGYLYRCVCTRKILRQDGPAYPGRCRGQSLPPDRPHALRVRVDDTPVVFRDLIQGEFRVRLPQTCGDFIVRRRDGLHAYQLAVVMDDADLGVTEVLRGADLLEATPRQIYLQRLLGLPTPAYCHIPVLVDARGRKLSKQNGAPPVTADRPEAVLFQLLTWLGQDPPAALGGAPVGELLAWAVSHWRPQRLPKRRQLAIMPITP